MDIATIQGLMRKRIASINEAPIRPEERRIAVPEGQAVMYNSWLEEQASQSGTKCRLPK